MTENERDQLREEIETAMRPAVDQAAAILTRPYRRALLWLGLAWLLLAAASVAQWVMGW